MRAQVREAEPTPRARATGQSRSATAETVLHARPGPSGIGSPTRLEARPAAPSPPARRAGTRAARTRAPGAALEVGDRVSTAPRARRRRLDPQAARLAGREAATLRAVPGCAAKARLESSTATSSDEQRTRAASWPASYLRSSRPRRRVYAGPRSEARCPQGIAPKPRAGGNGTRGFLFWAPDRPSAVPESRAWLSPERPVIVYNPGVARAVPAQTRRSARGDAARHSEELAWHFPTLAPPSRSCSPPPC